MIERILLVLCLAHVAWLTAGAMAVRSASRIWLRHWAERRLHGAELVSLYLERPQHLLTAANAGVAATLALAGVVIGWRSVEQQDIAVVGLVLYAGAMVIVGQLVPRAVARRWPSQVIPVTLPVLRVAQALAAPLLAISRYAVPAMTGAALDASHPGRTVPGEQSNPAMTALLREGELEGVGNREEIAIISGVMHFGEKRVRDVMTRRADVFAVAEDLDPARAAAQIAESKFSRVPVYRGSLDTVVGMYHAFDVLKLGPASRPPLRPVASTPPDARLNELLFRMLRQRLHLAVVKDDAARTLGIVTLENLFEELVGDIRDEHDEPAVRPAAATI